MSEYGELIAPDTVLFERLLQGTIDLVWRYLVEDDKRAKWLAGGDTEERVGGHVDLLFHNGSLSKLPDDPPRRNTMRCRKKCRIAARSRSANQKLCYHMHLDIMMDELAGKKPQPFWRTHTALEAEYEVRIC